MKNPSDDVKLSDEHGFMVIAASYEEHLRIANDTREVSFFHFLFIPTEIIVRHQIAMIIRQ